MDGILTNVRFISLPQMFTLRNTADLLDFMLHRVLSKTSVKIVCFHIATLHSLRGELTCGSFQLHIGW